MDYVYPSVYFCYFVFFLLFGGGVYFLVRSIRNGDWGEHGEDVKYWMLHDEESDHGK